MAIITSSGPSPLVAPSPGQDRAQSRVFHHVLASVFNEHATGRNVRQHEEQNTKNLDLMSHSARTKKYIAALINGSHKDSSCVRPSIIFQTIQGTQIACTT